MIALTWRQFRTQTITAVAALVVVAIALLITGPHLVHLYDTTVKPCKANGDCDAATNALLAKDHLLQNLLSPLVLLLPGLVGIFWGAPLIARELETGTYRLAWTQSVTRRRWLAVKLGFVGLACMAIAAALSLAVTWWSHPIDQINANRFGAGLFGERGIVPIGYAGFAFVLGAATGALLRRTLPAMATTLVAFIGARLAVTYWIRPHLMAPAHTTRGIRASGGLGFEQTPSSGIRFVTGTPAIPNAWIYSSTTVDKSGHPITTAFLQNACPSQMNPPPATGTGHSPAPDQGEFQTCVTKIAARYHELVTYQPGNRYWTFQAYETGIFLVVALLLAGACFWLLCRRPRPTTQSTRPAVPRPNGSPAAELRQSGTITDGNIDLNQYRHQQSADRPALSGPTQPPGDASRPHRP